MLDGDRNVMIAAQNSCMDTPRKAVRIVVLPMVGAFAVEG